MNAKRKMRINFVSCDGATKSIVAVEIGEQIYSLLSARIDIWGNWRYVGVVNGVRTFAEVA